MSDRGPCETCGIEYGIGDSPFCRDGHQPYRPMVADDQLDGGPQWIENLGHQPVWVETKSQLRHELAARQLEPFVRSERTPRPRYDDPRFYKRSGGRFREHYQPD